MFPRNLKDHVELLMIHMVATIHRRKLFHKVNDRNHEKQTQITGLSSVVFNMKSSKSNGGISMIWFFSLVKASAGVCDTYNDLFQYFCKAEMVKWQDAKSIEAITSKIISKKTNKKQWCLDYCRANQYVIVENQKKTDPKWR